MDEDVQSSALFQYIIYQSDISNPSLHQKHLKRVEMAETKALQMDGLGEMLKHFLAKLMRFGFELVWNVEFGQVERRRRLRRNSELYSRFILKMKPETS